MEESRFRGESLYCCFLDFMEAFDMIPCEHLWKCMEDLKVASEYICLQFPESMRRLYVVCIWIMKFQDFSIALLLLSKDTHSH